MPCDITVYCDNATMWSKFSKGIYAGYTENDMEGIRNAVLVKRLRSMLKFHDISVELAAENKHTQTVLKSLKEKMDKGIICRKENNQ